MKKSVIITGSNRGIGRSMVKKFAGADYDIYACARIPMMNLSNSYIVYQKEQEV